MLTFLTGRDSPPLPLLADAIRTVEAEKGRYRVRVKGRAARDYNETLLASLASESSPGDGIMGAAGNRPQQGGGILANRRLNEPA